MPRASRAWRPFSLFEISPVGIPLTMIGIIYLCTVGMRLSAQPRDALRPFGRMRQRQFLTEVLVPLGSPLVGKTADQSDVAKKLNARVIDVIRDRVSLASSGQGGAAGRRPDRAAHQCRRCLGLREKSDVLFGGGGQHALEPIATQNTR